MHLPPVLSTEARCGNFGLRPRVVTLRHQSDDSDGGRRRGRCARRRGRPTQVSRRKKCQTRSVSKRVQFWHSQNSYEFLGLSPLVALVASGRATDWPGGIRIHWRSTTFTAYWFYGIPRKADDDADPKTAVQSKLRAPNLRRRKAPAMIAVAIRLRLHSLMGFNTLVLLVKAFG